MNNSTRSVLIFVSGLAIGAVSMYELVKTKFEEMANEEIESVKQMYREKLEEKEPKKSSESDNSADEKLEGDIIKAGNFNAAVKAMHDYTGHSKEKKEIEEAMDKNKPYVISPDEFSELDDYTIKSLTYYTDGVLTDESGKVINDVEGMVGEDSLEHFGEYEEDCVYVRNDDLSTDFEILRDYRAYSYIR